ncbi:MAG: glycosyltransferase family 39 protein [Bacteroidia bacterium]
MKHKHLVALITALFYLLLFIPFLGKAHLFDWDEVNFAEAAREMVVSGQWLNVQVNFEPFWEKPPLFIWLQTLSMHCFGVNDFAARFPNVIVGLISIMLLYYVAFKHYGQQAAIASTLLYLGSFTPHLYFKSGIIDPLFNLFILVGVLQLCLASSQKRSGWYFFIAGLFIGLAVLTKGPVAILIAGLAGLAYQVIYRNNFYKVLDLVKLVIGIALFPAIYFGIQISNHGWWFLSEFIGYQWELFSQPVASHGQPFYYHPLVLLIGCFPLTVLAIHGIWLQPKKDKGDAMKQWMKVLFWVVLILFSAVTTKIVHYSSLCYFPLAILAGEWLTRKFNLSVLQKVLLVVISTGWTIALIVMVRLQKLNSFDSWIEQIEDLFTQAQLTEQVTWTPLAYVLAALLLLSAILLIVKYSKANLMSYLIFNVFLISLVMQVFIPRIESHTQLKWVKHLSTYQGKDMIHLTQGFKSYAHLYYTHQQKIDEAEEIKQRVLRAMGKSSFYELNMEDKQSFEVLYRSFVIDSTQLDFSLSTKISDFEKFEKDPKLELVFSGNGYQVWERKN